MSAVEDKLRTISSVPDVSKIEYVHSEPSVDDAEDINRYAGGARVNTWVHRV